MRSEAEVSNLVMDQISSMEQSGYTHESTTTIHLQGYETRHMKGEIRLPDQKGRFFSDSFAILSDAATLSVSIAVNAAGGTREAGAGLIDLVTIPGKPVSLTSNAPAITNKSSNYLVGMVIGFIAIGVVAIFILVKLLRSAKRS